MIYVKEDDYTSKNISPSVMWDNYLQDGGWLTLFLPKNFELNIIQMEWFTETVGQQQYKFTFPRALYKPRYFFSPGMNFWNVENFYINKGADPDNISVKEAWLTITTKQAFSGTYYGTFAVLGLAANSIEGNEVYG